MPCDTIVNRPCRARHRASRGNCRGRRSDFRSEPAGRRFGESPRSPTCDGGKAAPAAAAPKKAVKHR
jgi:hypothetical protein